MGIIAGIDIGNATTETAIADIKGNDVSILSSGISMTTGVKGTSENVHGLFSSLTEALKSANIDIKDLSEIRINEAAPVIGDVAMETITETIITESTMIGHNPETPGGLGTGTGYTTLISDINNINDDKEYVVVIPKEVGFEEAAKIINDNSDRLKIQGAIVQSDDGVLINNRINKKIPIVDEVKLIDKVPIGMYSAIEVADVGEVIQVLSNPYGIATLFSLDSEETKHVVPIARALIGNRSAVVVKTPEGDVKERSIPAGFVQFIGDKKTAKVDIDRGAKEIMDTMEKVGKLQDVKGESGTNAGGMFEKVRVVMSQLTKAQPKDIHVQDLLAVDTLTPMAVKGGLANEFSKESAVGVAVMVQADKLQLEQIANDLSNKLNVDVIVGGVEADMAIRGALTTPGTNKPIAILDMGAGSTDASIMTPDGKITSIHLAGAGNMVSMLIQAELGLDDFETAELIKKFPLCKVESMFHVRHEDGTVEFFDKPLNPDTFARVCIITDDGLVPLEDFNSLEPIRQVRRQCKEKVFVTNAVRALTRVSPTNNVRDIQFVVMVGGSALDFEIPQLVTDALSKYSVVSGRGNIRGTEGPRNAVATGLVLSVVEGSV
ncbi:MAG: diol dehydratase reactivase subunit alpha [Coriobacteriia bacterium]|nr:diol dehydratase reactivase subunit alpha [Coriobacteriia bacterium]